MRASATQDNEDSGTRVAEGRVIKMIIYFNVNLYRVEVDGVGVC